MKYVKGILALSILAFAFSASAPAFAQSDSTDYYQKKAIADAAQKVLVDANSTAINEIKTAVIETQNEALDLKARFTTLEAKIAADNAAMIQLLQELKAQPGITTGQVIDAIVARLAQNTTGP